MKQCCRSHAVGKAKVGNWQQCKNFAPSTLFLEPTKVKSLLSQSVAMFYSGLVLFSMYSLFSFLKFIFNISFSHNQQSTPCQHPVLTYSPFVAIIRLRRWRVEGLGSRVSGLSLACGCRPLSLGEPCMRVRGEVRLLLPPIAKSH